MPKKQNSDSNNVSEKTGMLFAFEFVHNLKILLKIIDPQKYSVLNKKENNQYLNINLFIKKLKN